MKKTIIPVICFVALLFSACQNAQNQGNDIASVDKIGSKYIYIHSKPVNHFTKVEDSHLDLISGAINSGNGEKGMKRFIDVMSNAAGDFNFDNRINKMIEQLNASGIDYDGVVFQDNLNDGYAIKFDN